MELAGRLGNGSHSGLGFQGMILKTAKLAASNPRSTFSLRRPPTQAFSGHNPAFFGTEGAKKKH